MGRSVIGALAATSLVVSSGCSINDPTESGGPMAIRNALDRRVSVSYCDDQSCKRFSWTDKIEARGHSSDSVAADGSLSRFIVVGDGLKGCITVRLTRAAADAGLTIRRSMLRPC